MITTNRITSADDQVPAPRDNGNGQLAATPQRAIARADSYQQFLADLEQRIRVCEIIAKSGAAAQHPNWETIFAVALYGSAFGLDIMTALRNIHLIEGKPSLGAALMQGLAVREANAKFTVVTRTPAVCTIIARRPGWDPFEASFTWQEAQQITVKLRGEWGPLTQKSNWRSYPAAMLHARALAIAARHIAADVLAGVYTPDELGSETDPGMNGDVIDVTPAGEDAGTRRRGDAEMAMTAPADSAATHPPLSPQQLATRSATKSPATPLSAAGRTKSPTPTARLQPCHRPTVTDQVPRAKHASRRKPTGCVPWVLFCFAPNPGPSNRTAPLSGRRLHSATQRPSRAFQPPSN